MSLDQVRQMFRDYLESHDARGLAEDVEFTDMTTGQTYRGREGVSQMLHWFYHVAFDARADIKATVVDERHALLEAELVGRHIGEFAGIPATGKDVRVPFCVTYDIDNGEITRGRVYFLVPVLLQQLGVMPQPVAGTAG